MHLTAINQELCKSKKKLFFLFVLFFSVSIEGQIVSTILYFRTFQMNTLDLKSMKSSSS